MKTEQGLRFGKLRRLMGLDSRHSGGSGKPPGSGKSPNAPRPVTCFDSPQPVLPLSHEKRPFISFVVIVYSMPEQARRTLFSLSVDYQSGVGKDDYEIIVVENASRRLLGRDAACEINANVRYFCLDDSLASPVPALNFGAEQARGSHVAYLIDGARLVTPGVVHLMIIAASLAPRVVAAVPGYHLGSRLQQKAVLDGYDEANEAELMRSICWPDDGYRLFEIACLSGTSAGGYFKPIGESNCLCLPRKLSDEIGGYDKRFVQEGGGQVNMDFYKRAVEAPDSTLVILPGEGSFHQFHGGISTGRNQDRRQELMDAYFAEYRAIRNVPFCPPSKRAIYLGAVPDSALKFTRHGADAVLRLNGLE